MDKIILDNKPKLIKWLSVDAINLLQHVQSRILTMDEYRDLMSTTPPRIKIINLLDLIIGKGESTCRIFLNLLKEEDVNESFPELRDWIKTVDTSETANTMGNPSLKAPAINVKNNISASSCSNVYMPTITGASTGSIEINMNAPSGRSHYQKPDRDWGKGEPGNRTILDHQKFLQANTSHLVQNVKSIDLILDDLKLHQELTAIVRAEKTDQNKMRKLLNLVNCESLASKLVAALFMYEEGLMKELKY